MVKVDFDLDGVKIPKKVAGMKVPRKLRKQGNKLIAKANSPEGREAIATGLAIVGTAIAAKARAKAERRATAADERAAAANSRAAEESARAAAAEEEAKAKVVRHPSASPRSPGEPGIDPARHLGPELERAITSGLDALQSFLGSVKKS